MTAADLAGVIRGIGPVIREYAGSVVGSFGDRLTAIERRLESIKDGAKGDQGEPGRPGDMGLTGPKGDPGRDADPALIEALKAEILEARKTFTEALATRDALIASLELSLKSQPVMADLVAAAVAEAVAALPPAKDGAPGAPGASVDPMSINAMVAEQVSAAVAALPTPKDGKDGDSVMNAFIDRGGHLILTLSDGTTKDVGPVLGKDVDFDEVKRIVLEELSKWPKPTNGIDGKDGLGFDDLETDFDAHGHLILRLVRGDQVKEIPVPGFVDRGVYRSDESYVKGDGATFGGSFWIAQKDAPGKPGDPESGWRLAVKKGADGKRGEDGKNGLDGKNGRDGKDRW